MFKQIGLAVVTIATLGAGTAHAASSITDIGDGKWRLVPDVGAEMVFNCSPCVESTSSLPTGYSNPYDGPDNINQQRIKFFGSEHIVLNSDGGPLTAAGGSTGETKGIMVKDDGSTFFFDYAGSGSTGIITYSFDGKVASNVTFTPIPVALGLLLTGLAGLYGIKRFRRHEGEAVPA